MKKRFKEALSLLLVVCILSTMLIPNKAYAETVPSDLKSSVNKVLKAFKESDEKTLKKYCNDYDSSDDIESDDEYAALYENLIDFMSDNAAKMEYSIKSYDVKGNTANVKVKFKYIDASEFSENFLTLCFIYAFRNALSDEEITDKAIEDAISKAIKVSDCSSYKTDTINLKFKKYGETWKLAEYSDDLDNIVCSNIPYSLEKYAEEISDSFEDE